MSMVAFTSFTCAHTHVRAESDRESASLEKLMLVSQPLIENRWKILNDVCMGVNVVVKQIYI